MNAAGYSPSYTVIHVQPDQPVQLPLGKTFSSQAAPSALDALPSLPPLPALKQTSILDPAQLIVNGGDYDVTVKSQALAPSAIDATVGEFNCATDPYQPDIAQGAYGIYRFDLKDFLTAGLPQSIGTLWAMDSAPSRYFVGLSNWQSGRWEWYEGSLDNVVTVASLAPYIRSSDNTLLAAVVVLDSKPRELALLQIGAEEIRGLGGLIPDSEAGLTCYGPEDYYPGKTTSTPGYRLLDETKFGAVYDQGLTLSCTACACAAMGNYEFSTAYAPYWRPTRPSGVAQVDRALSPKWLYKETLLGACFTGRAADWILTLMQGSGAPTLRDVPWNGNCPVDYDVGASYAAAAYLKLNEWHRIHCSDQIGIDEIRHQIGDLGHPVVFSMTVPNHFGDGMDASTVFHWDGSAPDILRSHTMLITGYNDALQAFHVRNSWGSGWVDNGSFWLGYDNLMGGPWIFGAFVASANYSAAPAAHFSLTQNAAVAPANASCTSLVSAVRVNWSPVQDATGYRIYRDAETNQIATLTTGALGSFDDGGVTDFLAHTYFIRTVVESSVSPTAAQARGWRILPAPPYIRVITNVRVGQTQLRFYPVLDNPDSAGTVSYSWTFPPGSIMEASPRTERVPLVTGNTPGTYSGSLTATNTTGQYTRPFSFTVYAPSSNPLASFTLPPNVIRNTVVTFDAGGSTPEPGFKVAHYGWDFDQDGNYDELSDVPMLSHIFTVTGPTTVELQVIDDRGLTSDWASQSFDVMP